MDLKAYFEGTKGTGFLATADENGKVDIAVYGKPHFPEDGTVAFIMADRLTHNNLQVNDSAAYLFMEAGEGYKGEAALSHQDRRRAGLGTPLYAAEPEVCIGERRGETSFSWLFSRLTRSCR